MDNSSISNKAAILVAKEDIPNYQFVSYDVLETKEQRAQRKLDLEKAMVLGNGEQVKISIHFHTTDGLKKVETTVWAATDESIVLKGGVSIPMHCVQEIRFV